MNLVYRKALAFAAGTALLSLAPGCGGGAGGANTVTVTGKVHKGGKPLPVGKDCLLEVTFVPHGDGAEGNSVEPYRTADGVYEDGTFKVRDLPPGKYRVTVELRDPSATKDLLGGAYTAKNSPFLRDVAAGATIDLDLANPSK